MAAGCGGDDDEAARAVGTATTEAGGAPEGMHAVDRQGRGPGQPDRLGRLRRGRQHRSQGRLGHGLREADRLPGQHEGRQHLRRDGDADAHRPVRRRLGLRRRDAAADRRGRRRPGQHRPDPELRGRLRGPQEPAAQLRRRPDVRRPARPRREPADVADGQGQAGARLAGASSGTRTRRTRARSRRTTARSTSRTPRCT